MTVLLLVGLLAGVVTSISPCVLPVLPVVLSVGASGRRAALLVVAGLVTSFAAATLFGSVVLSALGLPQDLLRDVGIAVLLVVGVSLVVPPLARLIERPFARLTLRRAPRGRGLGLGLALGLLYVPCAGPVLATIAVVGATHHVSWRALVLTVAFAVGAGVPLLVFALAGEALASRVAAVRQRAGAVRIGSGVVMVALAVLLAFNLTDGLQTHVPGYTASLQQQIEGGSDARSELSRIRGTGGGPVSNGPDSSCTERGDALENCGAAPEFAGISAWLNTPDGTPLTMAALRGKVVLVDFWTYSCINCLRALPQVRQWYSAYASQGLVVVGVHTPEFAFEHVVSNVSAQARALGVHYPVAVDNDYRTWNAYGNQYWPAEYLIDATGRIRHVVYGEGDYDVTERLIRQLLQQARPGASLGYSAAVPQATFSPQQTPETYLGSFRGAVDSTAGQTVLGGSHRYRMPASVEQDRFALGGTWNQTAQYLQAGASATLALRFQATHAYLVLGGSGTVTVTVDGKPRQAITVSGVPKLYPVFDGGQFGGHLLTLGFTPGVQAYSFTFG